MIDVDSICTFLAKAWSENQRIAVTRSPVFGSNPGSELFVPDYFGGEWQPGLEGLPRWRIFRFTLFHEAMHELMSPTDKENHALSVTEKILSVFPNKGDRISLTEKVSRTVGYLLNIIEDDRVERIGLRTYRGYVDERTFRTEFARVVTTENYMGIPEDKVSEFEKAVESYRRGALIGMPPPPEHDFLNPLIEQCHATESFDDVMHLSLDVFTEIARRYNMRLINKDNMPTLGEQPKSMVGRLTQAQYEKLIAKHPELAATSKLIARELESITGKSEVDDMMEDAAEGVIDLASDAGPGGRMEIHRKWNPGSYSTLMQNTQPIIRRLQTMLRKWQVGWDEVLNHRGDDVDTDEYVLARLGKESQRFYIDERRITQKARIAVLCDMSGSITGVHTEYLRAVGIIAESLHFVGVKFAIFCFDGDTPSRLSAVKLIAEPWELTQKNKLSTVVATGGTPLDDAMDWMVTLSNVEHYDQLIVLTDGEPSGGELIYDKVLAVNARIPTSMIGLFPRGEKSLPSFFRKWSRTGKLRVIHKLDDLPTAFFDLVRSGE